MQVVIQTSTGLLPVSGVREDPILVGVSVHWSAEKFRCMDAPSQVDQRIENDKVSSTRTMSYVRVGPCDDMIANVFYSVTKC